MFLSKADENSYWLHLGRKTVSVILRQISSLNIDLLCDTLSQGFRNRRLKGYPGFVLAEDGEFMHRIHTTLFLLFF